MEEPPIVTIHRCCFAESSPVDTSIVTNNSVTIKGQQVNYRAETGFQPVWDADGKMIASLYYTYYKRTNDSKGNKRPIIYSFNGGPGSASVWMHIAYQKKNWINCKIL